MTDGLNGTGEYTFGDFTYRSSDNTLRRGDEILPVTPKALDLLRVLIANPRKLLTKEELMNMLWPDSFVEEGNLAVTIRRLRKALADDAHTPAYIETVARQGYRFVAEVDQTQSEGAIATVRDNRQTKVRYLVPLAVAAGLLIASISLGSLYFRGDRSQAAPILSTPFAARKLSTTGKVFAAVVSPDGERIIYTVRSATGEAVWLREIATENNVEIIPASDQEYYRFAISPDGSTVYFTRGARTPDDPADLFSVSIFGGVPKRIVSNTRAWISVSPDGKTISFVRCGVSENVNCALLTANSSDGSNERVITTRPNPYRIAAHKITLDGRSIVFAAGQSLNAGNDFGLTLVDLQSGVERPVTDEHFFNIYGVETLPDNSGLLFTARRGSTNNYQIWKLNYADGSVQPLSRDSNSYASVSLDDSGLRLVATEVANDSRLVRTSLFDLDQKGTIADQVWLFAFDARGEILYQSGSTGDIEIWRMNADGSNQRLLTNSPGNDTAPISSRDASEVYFCSNRSGEMEVWRMNADGSDQRILTRTNGGMPMFASDDWIYYQHGIDRTLWRVSPDGEKEEQVLKIKPYTGPFVFSRTGTRVAYVDRMGGKRSIKILSIPEGRELANFELVDGKGRLELAWLPDESAVAYTSSALEGETNTVWIQQTGGGPPRLAATLGDEEIRSLAFTPQGDSLVFVQGSWKHDMVLLSGLE